jgi:hypothetical protein
MKKFRHIITILAAVLITNPLQKMINAMKKLQLFLLVLLLMVSIKALYPQRELVIDTDDNIHLKNVKMDFKGDFVAVFSRDSLDYNFTGGVIKFNQSLEYQILSLPYDSAYYILQDIVITDDNNYLIVGTIGENIGYWVQNHTIYLLLLDENLNTIAENFYELGEQYTNPYIKMLKNTDGKIYITFDEPSNFLKGTLEVSPNAEIIKDKMNYNMSSATINPFPKPDGGLYLFRHIPVPWARGGITAVDTNLNFDTTYLFPQTINGVYYDMSNRGSCKWLNDTTYILCSYGFRESATYDIYIYKVNDKHEFMTEPFIIGNEYEKDLVPQYQSISWIDPQKIYVASYTELNMNYRTTYYAAVINEDLELLGYKICGEDYNTYITSVLALENGGCLMIGWQRDYHAGNPLDGEAYIAIFSPDDIITSAAETTNPYDSDYMLYPNPGSDQLNIQSARKGVKIEIFDQSGRMVLQQKLNDEFRNVIFTGNLRAGLYYCKLTDKEGFVENKKWVKH